MKVWSPGQENLVPNSEKSDLDARKVWLKIKDFKAVDQREIGNRYQENLWRPQGFCHAVSAAIFRIGGRGEVICSPLTFGFFNPQNAAPTVLHPGTIQHLCIALYSLLKTQVRSYLSWLCLRFNKSSTKYQVSPKSQFKSYSDYYFQLS